MRKAFKYIGSILIMIAIIIFTAKNRQLFSAENFKEAAGILSDCFLVPGVLLAGAGALGWAATTGIYDMFGFGAGHFMRWFIPSMDKRKYDDFYEYKKAKNEEGRKWKPYILLEGAACLAIALIFFILYNIL